MRMKAEERSSHGKMSKALCILHYMCSIDVRLKYFRSRILLGSRQMTDRVTTIPVDKSFELFKCYNGSNLIYILGLLLLLFFREFNLLLLLTSEMSYLKISCKYFGSQSTYSVELVYSKAIKNEYVPVCTYPKRCPGIFSELLEFAAMQTICV